MTDIALHFDFVVEESAKCVVLRALSRVSVQTNVRGEVVDKVTRKKRFPVDAHHTVKEVHLGEIVEFVPVGERVNSAVGGVSQCVPQMCIIGNAQIP